MAGDQSGSTRVPTSHFQRIGGAPAVREAVDRFYVRLLDDPELAPYFTDIELTRLKRHQVLLISQLLGGPAAYDGRALGEAHAGLGVTGAHYDRVVDHLVTVLREMGVGDDTLGVLGEAVAAVRPEIVTVSGAAGGATDP